MWKKPNHALIAIMQMSIMSCNEFNPVKAYRCIKDNPMIHSLQYLYMNSRSPYIYSVWYVFDMWAWSNLFFLLTGTLCQLTFMGLLTAYHYIAENRIILYKIFYLLKKFPHTVEPRFTVPLFTVFLDIPDLCRFPQTLRNTVKILSKYRAPLNTVHFTVPISIYRAIFCSPK